MTISAVRRSSPAAAAGFTLLEMVVAMTVAIMILGGALGALYFQRDERRLNDVLQEVEVMAKRARTVAALQIP